MIDLLAMILRKIFKSKWLILCLFIGLLISVALISSIPIYSSGILQKLLIKELEASQIDTEKFPGLYEISLYSSEDEIKDVLQELKEKDLIPVEDKRVSDFIDKRLRSFEKINNYARENISELMRLPVKEFITRYSTDVRLVSHANEAKEKNNTTADYVRIESISGLFEHIRLLDGRLPEDEPVDGVYEVILSETALNKYDIVLGDVLILEDPQKLGLEPIRIKAVGEFAIKDNDLFWSYFSSNTLFKESVFISENSLVKNFIMIKPTLVYSAQWKYAFDYHSMTIDTIGSLIDSNVSAFKDIRGIDIKSNIFAAFIPVLESYIEKEARLERMLLILNVPVIIMLFLYLFMVSQLIIDSERNEISVLASRGAYRSQIVAVYLIEGLILGGAAFLAGPWLGFGISRLLGASRGFLEFADRKALPVSMNLDAFKYALTAVAVSLITMLIPAYLSSKVSIVSHKQKLARGSIHSLWEKLFLDVILLLVSVYGYRIFLQRQEAAAVTAVSALDLQIDPLLFVVPVLFILGAGMFFLRLYPFIIRGVNWLGRRYWPPTLYAMLTQLGRTFKSYNFLVIFIILTLSVGVFSATSARTINRNAEEKILYSTGSDMVLQELWEDDLPDDRGYDGISASEAQASNYETEKVNYREPSFLRFSKLDGVQYAAKVFDKSRSYIEYNGNYIGNVRLMAADSYDFGQVAWFRNGLMPHHINEYLNLLASSPDLCLISESISKEYGIQVGDYINAGWVRGRNAVFTVGAIITYWPSWNPNMNPQSSKEEAPMLVVANLPYIQDHLGLEPYKVWMKLAPDAKSSRIYEGMQENGIRPVSLTDARQQIVELKNSPFHLAINGALTLGFMICGIISFLGFLIFWILSINKRTLQFGIFRAMGMSSGKLISIIVWEQLLTSGAAIFSGIIIGLFASRLFVPFFQMAFDTYSQVPPFQVISYMIDRIRIYLLTGSMLIIGLVVLGILISRINMSRAIKLGED